MTPIEYGVLVCMVIVDPSMQRDDVGKWVGSRVSIITSDGRHLVGVLRGVDQLLNVVLQDAVETVYSTDAAPVTEDCGDYVLRGDDVMCVGLVNTDREMSTNLEDVRFSGLAPVT